MVVQPPGCIKCGSKEHLRECSRCHGIRYCSKDCQAADWSVHKPACTKEETERLSAQYAKAKQDGTAGEDQDLVCIASLFQAWLS